MKNLYNLSLGQLVTLWFFGGFAWLYTLDGYGSSFATFWFIFIPFVLIFYTFGWISHRMKMKKAENDTQHKDMQEQKEIEIVKQNKFKMNLRNSWWQCLVALLVGWLVIRTATIFILVFSHVRLENEDIQSAGAIVALVFAVWFSRYLSRKIWEKRQKVIQGN